MLNFSGGSYEAVLSSAGCACVRLVGHGFADTSSVLSRKASYRRGSFWDKKLAQACYAVSRFCRSNMRRLAMRRLAKDV